MLALSAIQTTIKAQIDAAAFFSASPSVLCVVDDGLQDTTIETQLRTKGFVIVIPPVIRAGRRDMGGGKLALDSEVAVRIMANPHVNVQPTGAQRNIYSAIAAAVQAVLQWQPATAGDRKFDVADEWLQIATNDPGLLSYNLFFTKLSTLN